MQSSIPFLLTLTAPHPCRLSPMSEHVRLFLESRVPELEDLFKKGLFSREEIKDIVAKRTKFEHKIKRRGCLLDDILAYIRYETDLEATRKERVALLKVKGKHSVSDHSIVKYILSLYRMAVRKFRGCMSLWDQYIAFAQEAQAFKVMPKIFASALQMHPDAVDIWIKAARWELDQLQNPASARALFMRGIRFNRNSTRLWFAYFQMELEVADRLAAKRLELADAIVEDEPTAADNGGLSVFSGGIGISVFKYAVRDCPLTAADAVQFYQLALKYSERLDAVQAFIYDFVSQPGSFADAYKFFVAKAEEAISGFDLASETAVSCVENCMRELNAALSLSPSADVACSLSPEVIFAVMDVLRKLLDAVESDHAMGQLVGAKMDRIFQSAQENSCMTPELYQRWVALYPKGSDKQREILTCALSAFPEDIELQKLKLSLAKTTDLSQVKATILAKLSPKSAEFDDTLADILGSDEASNDDLLDLAHAAIKNGRPVPECVKYVLRHDTLDALLASVEISRVQASFLMVLLTCLLDANMVSKTTVVKFLNKLTVFNANAYKTDVDLCLLLAKAALIAGDLDLLGRVSSHASFSETFTCKFEELKASFY